MGDKKKIHKIMEFSATGVVNHNNTEYDSLNSSINTK